MTKLEELLDSQLESLRKEIHRSQELKDENDILKRKLEGAEDYMNYRSEEYNDMMEATHTELERYKHKYRISLSYAGTCSLSIIFFIIYYL